MKNHANNDKCSKRSRFAKPRFMHKNHSFPWSICALSAEKGMALYMAIYVNNGCPVCGCVEYSEIGAVKHESPPVTVPEGSTIVKCRDCRLIYVNPMPHWSSEDFSKLYDQSYFAEMNSERQKAWLEIREHVIPRYRFKMIAPHLKSDKNTLLEVGAGEYAFMCRYLLDKGWDVTAQEPGETFSEKLRGINGLLVEARDVLELDGEGRYSLIFADSVLEHVPDPAAYYMKLSSLLSPGGVLYTVSPNEYSAYNFILNFKSKSGGQTPHYISPYEPPYHLIGFTKKSLQILAGKSGLKLLSYKKIKDYMAFNILNSGHSPLVKYPTALFFAMSQGVGLGTNGEAMFMKES